MDLEAIIDQIADEADDFLAGASNRAQARAGVEEFLTAEHPALAANDRAQVVAGVMQVLEREGFFDEMPASKGPEEAEDDEGD